ncbi:hypothetical protein [Hafnia paralvei]|uniref:hypothetical protein n=1 Tax=Hafnia paralvei TaxID=546367 RepID=UPI001033EA35|nr:hypothetical protein [Hafnia paralvei]TBL64165.1 hypothetical protein EYY97_04945 [Hafnia paralvei]
MKMKLHNLILSMSAFACCMNVQAAGTSLSTVITTPPVTVTATLLAPVIEVNEARAYSSESNSVIWHLGLKNSNEALTKLTVTFDAAHSRGSLLNGYALSENGAKAPVYLASNVVTEPTLNGLSTKVPVGKDGVYSIDIMKDGASVWEPGSYTTVLNATLFN